MRGKHTVGKKGEVKRRPRSFQRAPADASASRSIGPGTGFPLDRIERYLDDCFARESPPRVSELARVLGIARERLVETFRAQIGITPLEYLRMRQVGAAKLLLRLTAIPVAKVGYMTGFGTRRTFFRVFQRLTGLTPAEFRNRTK